MRLGRGNIMPNADAIRAFTLIEGAVLNNDGYWPLAWWDNGKPIIRAQGLSATARNAIQRAIDCRIDRAITQLPTVTWAQKGKESRRMRGVVWAVFTNTLLVEITDCRDREDRGHVGKKTFLDKKMKVRFSADFYDSLTNSVPYDDAESVLCPQCGQKITPWTEAICIDDTTLYHIACKPTEVEKHGGSIQQQYGFTGMTVVTGDGQRYIDGKPTK